MQIASVIQPSLAPVAAQASAHVVAPGRLFQLGRLRLEGAIDRLTPDDATMAPSALQTVLAMRQVDSGISTLGSILVPSTPYGLQRRAASAIDEARDALVLLRTYHAAVRTLGDDPVKRTDVPSGTLLMFDASIDRLRSAVAIAHTGTTD